jgi:outer membrane protein assembly factor BamA
MNQMSRLEQRRSAMARGTSVLCRWLIVFLFCLPLQTLSQSSTLIVEELECRGNKATSCDFILGYLYLSPGDPVNEDEIVNARLRLASQPAFRSVDIYLEKGSSRDRVRVIVEVDEADPYAREWLLGTSWRVDSLSQLLNGRLTHQNLFGTGKLLDVAAVAYVPLHGRVRSEYGARVQYVDPHLLDAKRNYLIVGAGGGINEFEGLDHERFEVEAFGVDLTLGRRLWDFSYFSLFYRYNVYGDVRFALPRSDGSVDGGNASIVNHALVASYGWNSEDDHYFPTRGSRAVLRRTWTDITEPDWDGGFRKTWTTASGTSWYAKFLEQPGTEYRGFIGEEMQASLGFARPIAGSASGEIRRGRWYVEGGYSSGDTLKGDHVREYGLKVGVRFDTRSFGVVDLYAIGTGLETTSRGAP